MENKTADNTESLLAKDPELVQAIVEVLTKDMEAITALLEKKDLFEKN